MRGEPAEFNLWTLTTELLMIDRVLANQAIDKLLSTGDARLRRFGGCIFRSLRRGTAIEVSRNRTRTEIERLESESRGVMSDDLRSMLESLKEQLASCENDLRQIANEVNEVVLAILQLAI